MTDYELKRQLFELMVTPVGGYTPHEKQELFHRAVSDYRNVYWLAGRQVGKSLSAAMEATYALLVPHTDGKPQEISIVSDKLNFAQAIFEKIEFIFNNTPDLRNRIKKINHSNQRMEISLKNGARLRCKSSHNPTALAGDTVSLLITDESGFVTDRALTIARPTVAVRSGRHIAIGTADVESNWFKDSFQAFRKEGKAYEQGAEPTGESVALHASSTDSPFFTQEEFEAIKKRETARNIRMLYLAEFIDDEKRVFPQAVVDAVAVLKIPPKIAHGEVPLPKPESIEGRRFVAGIDIGRSVDYTVITILEVTEFPAKMIDMRRFNGKTPDVTAKRIASVLSAYQATGFLDATGVGDVYFEMTRRLYNNIRPFVFTTTSKVPLIENLMIRLENEDLLLYPDEVLMEELGHFVVKKTSSGHVKYEADGNKHDDTVISLALAAQNIKSMYQFKAPRIRVL